MMLIPSGVSHPCKVWLDQLSAIRLVNTSAGRPMNIHAKRG